MAERPTPTTRQVSSGGPPPQLLRDRDNLVDSPRAFFASYLDYTLADGIAEQITCPTLVCDAEEDIFFAGQPKMLFDHLTCEKTLLEFTGADGAGAHCQAGAQRLAFGRIYDWLDGIVGNT